MRLGGVPLRVRLVATLLALVALGLVLTGAAAARSLRGYLTDRLDDQLVRARVELAGRPPGVPGGGPRRPVDALNVHYVEYRDAAGRLVRTDAPDDGTPVPRLPESPRVGRPFTVEAVEGGGRWRVLVSPARQGTVTVALPADEVDRTVNRLVRIELVVGLAVVGLLGGLGYALVRSSLRPLVEVERTAEAIARGELGRRVPERDPRTEVGRLGRALNAMLGQIEGAFAARTASERAARESEQRMRRLVADASHELRTPLTSIRGFAELYRQGAVSKPAEVAKLMRRVEDEGARMGLLVDDLLLLARLDQQRELDLVPVDVLPLAADAVHDARAVAPDREIGLAVTGPDRPPVVLGDEPRLRQVLANLVSNALVHTPAGTPVEVTVGGDEAYVEIGVTDHGPGMTEADAARVFERFFRADPSRTRGSGGSGLGLSIVAALVAAHHGTVTVETAPGEGATFTVRLPRGGDEGAEPGTARGLQRR